MASRTAEPWGSQEAVRKLSRQIQPVQRNRLEEAARDWPPGLNSVIAKQNTHAHHGSTRRPFWGRTTAGRVWKNRSMPEHPSSSIMRSFGRFTQGPLTSRSRRFRIARSDARVPKIPADAGYTQDERGGGAFGRVGGARPIEPSGIFNTLSRPDPGRAVVTRCGRR